MAIPCFKPFHICPSWKAGPISVVCRALPAVLTSHHYAHMCLHPFLFWVPGGALPKDVLSSLVVL